MFFFNRNDKKISNRMIRFNILIISVPVPIMQPAGLQGTATIKHLSMTAQLTLERKVQAVSIIG